MDKNTLKKLEHKVINDNIKHHIEEEYEKGVTYYINVSKNKEEYKKDFRD